MQVIGKKPRNSVRGLQTLILVFMGDSITEGQYVASPARWTDIVADRLARKYHDTPVDLLIANKGVSGETTRQGLERYPRDVQALAPDVITLQFGLNDCNCWVTDGGLPRVSEGAYRANLVEMIERARHFGARHVILSTSHPTLRHTILPCGESLEERRKRYNAIVREIARTMGVTLCDIERAFDSLTDTTLAELLLPYPDQLHLSTGGHARYAEAIYSVIETAVADAIMTQEARSP